MPVAIRTATRIQDQDDINVSLGAGVNGNALVWDNASGKFVLTSAGGSAGGVVGPASALDGHLAVFDSTSGKLLKDGGAPGGGSMPPTLSVYLASTFR